MSEPSWEGRGAQALGSSLLDFIRQSPTAFHAVSQIRGLLDEAGFRALDECGSWQLEPGRSYYVERNGSSIIAFKVGCNLEEPAFRIVASHSDSPTFKVKAHAELEGPDGYLRINTELYGGIIERTWLDRPLTVAGRVMMLDDGYLTQRLVYVDRDTLIIPSVAIHLDRSVNEGGALKRHVDLVPMFSAGGLRSGAFDRMIADELGVDAERIVARDLYVVNRQPGVLWGAADEFVSAPRLDDLQCAFASVLSFIDAQNDDAINVCACFDNEEVGSGTMQGALSTFLPDVLGRVCACLGMGEDQTRSAYARSFLVSCDNAHAVHPNHPELHDATNRCVINGGVVIKETASQRYATDAMSHAVFAEVCRRAGVTVQCFANRSDMPGGSTLGNLAMRQVSMHAVDVGLPQLAMHSAYETAGVRDTAYFVDALHEYYASGFKYTQKGSVRFG